MSGIIKATFMGHVEKYVSLNSHGIIKTTYNETKHLQTWP